VLESVVLVSLLIVLFDRLRFRPLRGGVKIGGVAPTN
jgi:hypothetical protein